MMENLQEAYTAYQQALYHLRDPKVSQNAPRVATLVSVHARLLLLVLR